MDIKKRLDVCDPVGGVWSVSKSKKGRVWCDASSLVIGVCVEVDHVVVEDNCWLRKKDDVCHINLAELEAVVKGINMALAWNVTEVEILCDSAKVCSWIQSITLAEKRA